VPLTVLHRAINTATKMQKTCLEATQLCTNRPGGSVKIRALLVLCAVVATFALQAQTVRRRALLIGINDYTASKLGAKKPGTIPQRDWPNLNGAVNDVLTLREMLRLVYGFPAAGIVTLLDQQATRAAILQNIDQHLVAPAVKGDVVLLYFAGHGSQVRNWLSDEDDKLDESLVPADSRAGVRDIRDKELRALLNRLIDRGARVTVILDNCHSGSGARGLSTGARPRGIRPDLRDVADATKAGARPEDRGALVLAAAQDYDAAWETRDADGKMHGAFSWAWIRAMRDAVAGEPAMDTFLRAQARLRAETPYQEPVMAGNAQARISPFLGPRTGQARTGQASDRTVMAVSRVRPDGTVIVQGGWAHGLSVGSELRVIGGPATPARLRVTAILGLGQSEARMERGHALPLAIASGALLEVVGWAAPPGRPLRVWAPRVPGSAGSIRLFARRLYAAAVKRNIRWVPDPAAATPSHLLRRGQTEWELLGPGGSVERIGSDADALAAIARIPARATLFVQFPAPAALVEGIGIGPGTDREGINPITRAEDADYILTGRLSPAKQLEYAWIRPSMKASDRRDTGLPVQSAWVSEDGRDQTLRDTVLQLRDAVLRLRRIQAWHLLESPPRARYAYRLGVKRRRDRAVVRGGAVTGGEGYDLFLRPAAATLPQRVPPRYVYVFTIDSHGKSVLLFPQQNSGSVENRFPRTPPPPQEIVLEGFEVTPPYGVDTYFLLTTDEALPNQWILEWDGVRAPLTNPTPLERLLLLTGSAERGRSIVTPSGWSLEKVVLEAVTPGKSR
jgi:hypothetical protein